MIQDEIKREYREAYREYMADHRRWKGLERSMRVNADEPRKPIRKNLLLSSDFSDAGIYVMMQDNPISGTIVTAEFTDFFNNLNRKWTGQGTAFNNAKDNDSMNRTTRKYGEETIDEPTFSILGATTFASFVKVFTSTDTENGFFARIFPIVVSSPTKQRIPYLKRELPNMDFSQRMKTQINKWLDLKEDLPALISEDSEDFHNDWDIKFEDESKLRYGDRILQSVVRMIPGRIKIAMLLESLEIENPDGMKEIVLTKDTLECARMLIEDLFLPSMYYLFDNKVVFTVFELVEARIIKILESEGGWVDRSTLRKKSRIESKILGETLQSMEYREIIEKKVEASNRDQGGGNPKTYYRLKE